MEIKELKKRLSMATVLAHYGLIVEKNCLCCPFHDDTRPSMQYYPKTDTVYYFSASCSTCKQSLDIIGFIEKKMYLSGKDAKGSVFSYKARSQLVSNLLGSCRSYLPEVRDSEQVRQSVVKEWLKTRDIRMVQYLCGYRYVSSQERYRTDQLEALQAALAKIHPLNKPCKER